MRDASPPGRRIAAALVAAAILVGPDALPAGAAVHPGSIVERAEGSAPVVDGRVDTAYARALDEVFRRAVLAALRGVAPELQSARDLETWQETVLARAADFVGAWRVLGHEERGGFVRVEAEVELWRDKLSRAARSPDGGAPLPAVRLVVLAEQRPVVDRASGEELDAGRAAAAAIEAELARRGAVIVGAGGRAPVLAAGGAAADEDRAAGAAAEGRRLDADAVVIVRLAPAAGSRLLLTAELVAAATGATEASARAELAEAAGAARDAAFAQAARQVASGLAPRLAAVRASRARP